VTKQGVLPDGGVLKRLAENAPVAPGTTFDNEVANLMALKHDNIVQLVGFCHEAQKKVIQHSGRYVIVDMIESCLCYEYLANGSLDNHIYGMLYELPNMLVFLSVLFLLVLEELLLLFSIFIHFLRAMAGALSFHFSRRLNNVH